MSTLKRTLVGGWSYLAQFTPMQSLLFIVGISLIVKFLFIALFGGGFTSFPTEGSDGTTYHNLAVQIWQHGYYGYGLDSLTTSMPPGQSVFLSVVYALTNGSFLAAKLIQVLVLTGAAVLTYLTGRNLFNPPVALLGGLLVAMDPAQAYLSTTFLSDGLFITLMLLGLYFFLRPMSVDPHAWRWWIAAGVCFGLSAYVRNQGWLFALGLWGISLLTLGRWINLRATSVVLATVVLVIAPWTLRNYLVSGGHFIPISSEGGLTLWASNNPTFDYRPPMPMSMPIYNAPDNLSEYDLDLYYRRKALSWIRDNPVQFGVIAIKKFLILYHFDPTSWRPEVANLYRLAGLIPYGIMLPWIMLGLWQFRRTPQLAPIYTYIIFTTALAMVFYGDARIRAPIQPYLYLIGTAWLAHWLMPQSFDLDVPV